MTLYLHANGKLLVNSDGHLAKDCPFAFVFCTEDAIVVACDSAGNVEWTYDVGTATGARRCEGIVIDNNYNILVCGSHGAVSADKEIVTKLDPGGSKVWGFSTSGVAVNLGDLELFGIDVDAYNNAYVVGDIYYDKTDPTVEFYDLFKINNLGVEQYKVNVSDGMRSVACDSVNSFLRCVGNYGGCCLNYHALRKVAQNNGSLVSSCISSQEASFPYSYDNFGKCCFDYVALSDIYSTDDSVQTGSCGSFYDTGRDADTIDVDSVGDVYVGGYRGASSPYYHLWKVNSSGVLQWRKSHSAVNINSVSVSHNNLIFAAGNDYSTNRTEIWKFQADGTLDWNKNYSHATYGEISWHSLAAVKDRS